MASSRTRQLAGKSFGGGYADLGSGVRVDGARGFARDHGTDHVADREGLRSFLLGLALRGEGIGGFARLRDHDRQRVAPEDGIAVAELAAVIDFHRHTRQLLDHEFPRECGVPTGTAGDDLDLPELAELLGRDIHFVEKNTAGFLAYAAEGGIANGARLLVNFLEHEMLVAAFFRRLPA